MCVKKSEYMTTMLRYTHKQMYVTLKVSKILQIQTAKINDSHDSY